MKRLVVMLIVLLVAAATAAAVSAGNGDPIDTVSANALTLAVYGDSPYGTSVGDQTQVNATPAFINTINADSKVDLVLHVGDIHSGTGHCLASYDQTVAGLWQAFKDPLVYTPGDNEWTDCQKAKQGGWTSTGTTPWPCLTFAAQTNCDGFYDAAADGGTHRPGDPLDNLTLVRSLFFPTAGTTLGGRKKQVLSQAQVGEGTDANYVENVMWEQSKVLFVTVNVPGGSNNDADLWYGITPESSRQTQEREQRTQADLHWLDAAFAQATADSVHAVVITTQADMWDRDGNTVAHLSGYEPFIDNMARNTTAFGKPVLLLDGDSHIYRSDNPLKQGQPCGRENGAATVDCTTTAESATWTQDAWNNHNGITAERPNGYDVPNFHRLTVHGSTLPLEWVSLLADPHANNTTSATSFGPFSWQRIIPS